MVEHCALLYSETENKSLTCSKWNLISTFSESEGDKGNVLFCTFLPSCHFPSPVLIAPPPFFEVLHELGLHILLQTADFFTNIAVNVCSCIKVMFLLFHLEVSPNQTTNIHNVSRSWHLTRLGWWTVMNHLRHTLRNIPCHWLPVIYLSASVGYFQHLYWSNVFIRHKVNVHFVCGISVI